MKLLLVVVFVTAVNCLTDEQLWEEFKIKYNRNYKNVDEETRRYKNFQLKLKEISDHNSRYEKGEVSYYLGVNRFSDFSRQEYLQMLQLTKINSTHLPSKNIFKVPVGVDIPDSIDWRTQNVVTEVKNQLNCGSCWAFSSTGVLESQFALKHKKLISLSEQNLLDCSTDYGNGDCDVGGVMRNSWGYVLDHGINSEDDYPYEAVQKTCRYNQAKNILHISGYEVIDQNEEALKYAVALNGPISVAIDFSYAGDYAGGIFNNDKCHNKPDELNHGVLVVGYGTENGLDYWIVKNSWSAAYGENGYIRMIRNANNQCGIVDDATRPYIV